MATSNLLIGIRRVSSLGGRIVSADSTMTLDDQDDGLNAAAHAVNMKIGRTVDAVDQSGFTFAGSALMDELLAAVERGDYAGLAFAYFDRSGRNWWEQGPFFKRLATANGRFIVRGMEAIDYRSAVGRQVFGGMAVASETAHFAAKEKGNNIAGGLMKRLVPNRVSYGYRRNGTFVDGRLAEIIDADRDAKALVKVPETIAVVERIFRLKLDGFGIGPIANILNDDDVPGPRGNRWTKSTVASIVRNEIYMGVIVLGRRKRDRSLGDNVRRAHDPAVAIVTEREWKRAQSTRKVQRTGEYKAGVAGGILRCSGCGETLSVIGSGDGRKHYGCRRGNTKSACPAPVYVAKTVADEYVDEVVGAMLDGTVEIDAVALDRRIKETKVAWEKAEAELDALPDRVPFDHPKFPDYFARANAKVDAAKDAYDAATAQADAVADLPPDAATYMALPVVQRSRFARTLLAAVTVSRPVSRSKFAPIRDRFSIATA